MYSALIKKSEQHGKIVADMPYNNKWVSAIKYVIPSKDRKWHPENKIWTFNDKWYNAVLSITEEFFVNVVDQTGGVENLKNKQDSSWFRRLGEWSINERDRKADREEGPDDPYETLYLLPDAPTEVVKAAYRALSKLYHPDKETGDVQSMQAVNEAYDMIKQERK